MEIEFGDGDSADLGAVSGDVTATHVYDEDDNYTVRVTVTDTANQTTSKAIVITVLPGPCGPLRTEPPIGVLSDASVAAPLRLFSSCTRCLP